MNKSLIAKSCIACTRALVKGTAGFLLIAVLIWQGFRLIPPAWSTFSTWAVSDGGVPAASIVAAGALLATWATCVATKLYRGKERKGAGMIAVLAALALTASLLALIPARGLVDKHLPPLLSALFACGQALPTIATLGFVAFFAVALIWPLAPYRLPVISMNEPSQSEN